ncbi:MAG: hypothetical protein US20_C0005G0036 [Candidatus Pacebacteria bacterium GW2011_GWF1_36_5]|nr:MAG: hypothetical protein US20_C0005G0036 [Candidatus Pacebacteria bacterium GW2011_GWF1_36_5]
MLGVTKGFINATNTAIDKIDPSKLKLVATKESLK